MDRGLWQAGRTAGPSRVRRAVTSRSHEGSSFRRSGEVAFSGDYSQSGATVKQRGNDENDPSVVFGLNSAPVVYGQTNAFPTAYTMTRMLQFSASSCGEESPGGYNLYIRR